MSSASQLRIKRCQSRQVHRPGPNRYGGCENLQVFRREDESLVLERSRHCRHEVSRRATRYRTFSPFCVSFPVLLTSFCCPQTRRRFSDARGRRATKQTPIHVNAIKDTAQRSLGGLWSLANQVSISQMRTILPILSELAALSTRCPAFYLLAVASFRRHFCSRLSSALRVPPAQFPSLTSLWSPHATGRWGCTSAQVQQQPGWKPVRLEKGRSSLLKPNQTQLPTSFRRDLFAPHRSRLPVSP